MRVAIHQPAGKAPDGTEIPAAVGAYHLGRIEDFVNQVTGEVTKAEDLAKALLAQAKAEFPDLTVVIEHLIDNGDGTSRWASEPAATDTPAPPGATVEAPELAATQTQVAGGESA
ncbi:MAG TPA: hypothetical protein VK756_07765 [Solirubrobacteraceae bacterium]|jgi:hypothetical protein|nr:hypothetical protein [Solirubrobacteraceae bacterium]